MQFKQFIIPAFIIVILSACEGKDIEKSDIPQIEVKSVTPQNATAFQDTLIFEVFYRDGNGDLGENNPDVTNLFVKDPRNGVEYKYRIQQLSPSGSTIAIQGTLNIELPNVPLVGQNATTEQVAYEIRVVDRAGNTSNTATAPTVTVSQ